MFFFFFFFSERENLSNAYFTSRREKLCFTWWLWKVFLHYVQKCVSVLWKKSQFIEPSCWNKTFFWSFSNFVKLTTVHLPFKQTHYEGMKSVSLNNFWMFCLSSFLLSVCIFLSVSFYLSLSLWHSFLFIIIC